MRVGRKRRVWDKVVVAGHVLVNDDFPEGSAPAASQQILDCLLSP